MTNRTQTEILRDIAEFQPTARNWLALDDLLVELWNSGVTAQCLPTLFGVFERFPDEDGSGVFWSIVHGLESTELAYEAELRKSIARVPSEMGGLMLSRIEKAKVS